MHAQGSISRRVSVVPSLIAAGLAGASEARAGFDRVAESGGPGSYDDSGGVQIVIESGAYMGQPQVHDTIGINPAQIHNLLGAAAADVSRHFPGLSPSRVTIQPRPAGQPAIVHRPAGGGGAGGAHMVPYSPQGLSAVPTHGHPIAMPGTYYGPTMAPYPPLGNCGPGQDMRYMHGWDDANVDRARGMLDLRVVPVETFVILDSGAAVPAGQPTGILQDTAPDDFLLMSLQAPDLVCDNFRFTLLSIKGLPALSRADGQSNGLQQFKFNSTAGGIPPQRIPGGTPIKMNAVNTGTAALQFVFEFRGVVLNDDTCGKYPCLRQFRR